VQEGADRAGYRAIPQSLPKWEQMIFVDPDHIVGQQQRCPTKWEMSVNCEPSGLDTDGLLYSCTPNAGKEQQAYGQERCGYDPRTARH
jgi:hypothetical protein